MNIRKLEKDFDGTGEVKGYHFKQVHEEDAGYVYEVSLPGGHKHYEPFFKKQVAVCIDFDKKIFSETDVKEVYPKSKDFGVWAWTTRDLESAILTLKRARTISTNDV